MTGVTASAHVRGADVPLEVAGVGEDFLTILARELADTTGACNDAADFLQNKTKARWLDWIIKIHYYNADEVLQVLTLNNAI